MSPILLQTLQWSPAPTCRTRFQSLSPCISELTHMASPSPPQAHIQQLYPHSTPAPSLLAVPSTHQASSFLMAFAHIVLTLQDTLPPCDDVAHALTSSALWLNFSSSNDLPSPLCKMAPLPPWPSCLPLAYLTFCSGEYQPALMYVCCNAGCNPVMLHVYKHILSQLLECKLHASRDLIGLVHALLPAMLNDFIEMVKKLTKEIM